MSANRPVEEYKARGVSIAIWEAKVERDGRTVTRHSAKIEKRYFDKAADEWKSTETLFPEDLYRMRLLIDKALEFMELKCRSEEAPEAA